jgi:hypothetical protein
LLAQREDLGQELPAALQVGIRKLANPLAGEQSNQKTACQLGIQAGLILQGQQKVKEELADGRRALSRFLQRPLNLPDLPSRKPCQHVFFAREVIEKSPLAHIGSFGDLLDAGGGEAPAREEAKSSLQDARPGFSPVALPAAWLGFPSSRPAPESGLLVS